MNSVVTIGKYKMPLLWFTDKFSNCVVLISYNVVRSIIKVVSTEHAKMVHNPPDCIINEHIPDENSDENEANNLP